MNDLDYVTIRTLRAHVALQERELREYRRKLTDVTCERDLLLLKARKLGVIHLRPVANDQEPAHAL